MKWILLFIYLLMILGVIFLERKQPTEALLWVVVLVGFLIGVIVTVSEPDLQVLAQQVPGVPNATLVGAVAVGVGVFLVIAMLRILFCIPLNRNFTFHLCRTSSIIFSVCNTFQDWRFCHIF